MNFKEVAESAKQQTANLPPKLVGMSTRSQGARQAVVAIRAETTSGQGLIQTELAKIAPAVQGVEIALREGQIKVVERLNECDKDVADLRKLVEQAEVDLAGALKILHTQADALAEALPDAQKRIHGLVEAQRSQLDQDLKAEQAAQEALKVTLAMLGTTVSRLNTQAGTVQQRESDQVGAACGEVGAVAGKLTRMREQFAGECDVTQKHYQLHWVETHDSAVITPQAAAIVQSTVTGLQEQVSKPAEQAVEVLIERALKAVDIQMENQLAQLSGHRTKLHRSLQSLAGGPQLEPMVRASKAVLQRVGKLKPLGLENL